MFDFEEVIHKAYQQSRELGHSILREKCDADAAKLMLEPTPEFVVMSEVMSKKTWSALGDFYCSLMDDLYNEGEGWKE